MCGMPYLVRVMVTSYLGVPEPELEPELDPLLELEAAPLLELELDPELEPELDELEPDELELDELELELTTPLELELLPELDEPELELLLELEEIEPLELEPDPELDEAEPEFEPPQAANSDKASRLPACNRTFMVSSKSFESGAGSYAR